MIRDEYLTERESPPPWTMKFNCRVIKMDTPLKIRRKCAGSHNKAQHSGSGNSVAETLACFDRLLDDPDSEKKSISDLVLETYEDAGINPEKSTPVCSTVLLNTLSVL